jgi:acetyl-CoA/propionyl-CoA carboxylase biotin carboxyl carrier protein
MQATVVKVAVQPGDAVVKGDLVCVLEAMKMEQPIQAHRDGVIDTVGCAIGDSVTSGQVLATYQIS